MSEFLSNLVVLATLVAGLALLVLWVRRDAFSTSPAQRTLIRVLADLRPDRYESHAATATA